MITIGTYRDMVYSKYDEIWVITRSSRNVPNRTNVYWVPDLAPSSKLFKFYLENKDTWDYQKFSNSYVPRFLEDIHTNLNARKELNKLYAMDVAGKNILLVCACSHEDTCHRIIIAGLMQGVGCVVESTAFGGNIDYTMYYKLYKHYVL